MLTENKMKNTDYIKQLEELIEVYGLSSNRIADKLGTGDYSIKRWLKGQNIPNYPTRVLINQIYNGYKAANRLKK